MRKKKRQAFQQFDDNIEYYEQQSSGGTAKRVILVLLLIVLFAVLLIGTWISFYNYNLKPVGTSTESVIVCIPSGSTIEDTAKILKEEGVIRNAMVFESYAGRHSRGERQIQAGYYEFNQSMSVPAIFNKMLDGDYYLGAIGVTIPEGKNLKEIAELLEEQQICDADAFIEEASKLTYYKAKYPILSSIPENEGRTLEGYIFADTYFWFPNTEPDVIVTAMLDRFVEIYDKQMQADTKSMGKTVDEIVIMASLIELESKHIEDKANVASVFYNRIAADMPLQSDITVDYALGTKTPVLTEEQTQIDSPYNTYINKGLPIGPICSPSKTSIEAALHPANTNYYYFVADMDTGKLYFNETLDGHHADIEKYMD